MRRSIRRRRTIGLAAAFAVAAMARSAVAQAIEPRAFSPAPVGVNFLVAGLARSDHGLATDTALPVTDPELTVVGPLVGYGRTLDLLGRSAKLEAALPFGELSGSAVYQGQRLRRDVAGPGDLTMRVSVSLYGAPVMTPAEFRAYRQDLVVGVALTVQAPTGQYDSTRVLNLGANRWTFRPEIGAQKALGPWVVEVSGGATFFTANNDFFGGARRTQQPLFGAQGHVIYNFSNGMWASVDGALYAGGRTALNGQHNRDLQRNTRLGATLAVPLDRRVSIKVYASRGVSARTGNGYDLLGAAWQYRWGGGI